MKQNLTIYIYIIKQKKEKNKHNNVRERNEEKKLENTQILFLIKLY